MPEGSEAHITAKQLNNSHRSHVVESIKVEPVEKNKYLTEDIRWLNDTISTSSYHLDRVFAIGKKVVFHLSVYEPSEFVIPHRTTDIYLLSSLGLTGVWSYSRRPYTKLEIAFKGTGSIYFTDRLNMGLLEVISSDQVLNTRLSSLGIDLIAEDMSIESLSNYLSHHSGKLVADVMLDTSFTSTIGNYLRSEILYHARIHPFKPVHQIDRDQLISLHHYMHLLPRLSYQQGGASIRDYVSPDGAYGTFSLSVYKRKTTEEGYVVVEQADKNKRNVYYCPSIQY